MLVLLEIMLAVAGAIRQLIGIICISLIFAYKLWQGMPTCHFFTWIQQI